MDRNIADNEDKHMAGIPPVSRRCAAAQDSSWSAGDTPAGAARGGRS
jgi:hypothetical protein